MGGMSFGDSIEEGVDYVKVCWGLVGKIVCVWFKRVIFGFCVDFFR